MKILGKLKKISKFVSGWMKYFIWPKSKHFVSCELTFKKKIETFQFFQRVFFFLAWGVRGKSSWKISANLTKVWNVLVYLNLHFPVEKRFEPKVSPSSKSEWSSCAWKGLRLCSFLNMSHLSFLSQTVLQVGKIFLPLGFVQNSIKIRFYSSGKQRELKILSSDYILFSVTLYAIETHFAIIYSK